MQQQRRRHVDLRISWCQADGEGDDAHHHQRAHEHADAPDLVAKVLEDDDAQGAG